MLRIGLPVLLAVQLGGGFGSASATVISSSGDSVTISIEVEVETTVSAVVAHLVAPGEPELTIPMLQRPSGAFGITTELRRVDYRVVFEAIGDASLQSRPVSLSELGADFSLDDPRTTSTTDADDGIPEEARRWGWLGLAFAAASLSALAFWVLGGRDEDKGELQNQGQEVREQ
jgi:hypothetical protein